ncbi:hypothetical protein AMS66_06295 [Paenibacillus xylanivorans]|uniref:Uncharacterized protein n=1 Tax=Paenibacillus xylanivorans TaxID=1705561 RepID=A0A0N0C5L6_9BACL|nr:hypothetical protein AMS66_06295 [Paenibacillus xylanivorans]
MEIKDRPKITIPKTLLEKNMYNYLNLNMENAERQYKNARLMINLMKTEISIFFIYISWMIMEFSSGDKVTHHNWLPVVIFIIVFLVP